MERTCFSTLLFLALVFPSASFAQDKSIRISYNGDIAKVRLDASLRKIRSSYTNSFAENVSVKNCYYKSGGVRKNVECTVNDDGSVEFEIDESGVHYAYFVTEEGRMPVRHAVFGSTTTEFVSTETYYAGVYLPDESREEAKDIVESYAPVSVFHRSEEYFPKSIGSIVDFGADGRQNYVLSNEASRFAFESSSIREVISENHGSEASFEFMSEQNCSTFLPSGCNPHVLREYTKDIGENVIYWHSEKYGSNLYITYHYIYPFDPKGGSREDPGLAAHVFDRENITIKFSQVNGLYKPQAIAYAGHQPKQRMQLIGINEDSSDLNFVGSPSLYLADWDDGRIVVDWNDALKVGNHPVAYIAKGSHAVFPLQGIYRIPAHSLADPAQILREPAGSTIGSLLLLPPNQGNGDVKLVELDPRSEELFRFSGKWVSHFNGTSTAEFPPFIPGRYPVNKWFEESETLNEACNVTSAVNGCAEIENAFAVHTGLEGKLVFTVEHNSSVINREEKITVFGGPGEKEINSIEVTNQAEISFILNKDYGIYSFYKNDAICARHELLPFQRLSSSFTSISVVCDTGDSSLQVCENSDAFRPRIGNNPCEVQDDPATTPVDSDNDGFLSDVDTDDLDACEPSVTNEACRSLAVVTNVRPLSVERGSDPVFTVVGMDLGDDIEIFLEGNRTCELRGVRGRTQQRFYCGDLDTASDSLSLFVRWPNLEQLFDARIQIEDSETTPQIPEPVDPVLVVASVISVLPPQAVVGERTTFTVRGENFEPVNVVFFDGEICDKEISTASDGSQIVVECIPGRAGSNTVEVRNGVGGAVLPGPLLQVQVSEPVVVAPIASVSSVTPRAATEDAPVTFVITGQSLPDSIVVSLEGTDNCSITGKSQTQVTVDCVPQRSGTKQLYITDRPGGLALEGSPVAIEVQEVEVQPVPVAPVPVVASVSSVSPDTAVAGVPTVFTIRGENLQPVNSVFFRGEVCTNEISTAEDGSQIVVECTPDAEGSGRVVIQVRTERNGTALAGPTLFVQVESNPDSTGGINTGGGQEEAPVEEEEPPIVTQLTPTTATVGVPVTFTIVGRDLPSTIAVSLEGTSNCAIESRTTTRVILQCTPELAGTKDFYIADAPGGEPIEGSPVDVQVNEISATPQELLGTWQAADQLILPSGESASFDFRVEFRGYDVLYSEKYVIEASCGILTAEQKIESSYRISDGQLEVIYEEDRPRIIDECGGSFVQTDIYFEGEISTYQTDRIDDLIIISDECNFFFNSNSGSEQCVSASTVFRKIN